ncbi:MAG: hypothetical protein WBW88_16215 [Rhodothermales bacterium]
MNTIKLAVLVLSPVLIASSACDSTTEEKYSDVSIVTDKDEYIASPDEIMEVTIKNMGSREVFLLCGGFIGLEEWRAGRLEHSWNVLGMYCLRVDTIAPGGEKKMSWRFTNDYFEGGPVPDFTTEADYRFRALIYEDNEVKNLIDDEAQRSNEFEILSQASLKRE